MKRLSIYMFAFLLLFLPSAAYAQENMPKAGLTPQSPFYFLDKTGEFFELLFTFKEEKRVEKELQFAEERLAEMEAISETATEDQLAKLQTAYQKRIENVENKQAELSQEVRERIEAKKQLHIEVLERVRERVAQEYQDDIQAIISRVQNNEITKEEAREQISDIKEEMKEDVQEELDKVSVEQEDQRNVNKTDSTTTTPKATESTTQVAKITSPTKDAKRRYAPSSYSDVTVSFQVSPVSSNSNLQKLSLYLGNQEIYSTSNQTGSYRISKSVLNAPLNYVKVVAYFSEKQDSSDILIIDMSQFIDGDVKTQ